MNTYDLTATQRPPRTARQLAGTSHVTNNLFRILFHMYVRSGSFISCLFGLTIGSWTDHRTCAIGRPSQFPESSEDLRADTEAVACPKCPMGPMGTS